VVVGVKALPGPSASPAKGQVEKPSIYPRFNLITLREILQAGWPITNEKAP